MTRIVLKLVSWELWRLFRQPHLILPLAGFGASAVILRANNPAGVEPLIWWELGTHAGIILLGAVLAAECECIEVGYAFLQKERGVYLPMACVRVAVLAITWVVMSLPALLYGLLCEGWSIGLFLWLGILVLFGALSQAWLSKVIVSKVHRSGEMCGGMARFLVLLVQVSVLLAWLAAGLSVWLYSEKWGATTSKVVTLVFGMMVLTCALIVGLRETGRIPRRVTPVEASGFVESAVV